jgi:hypothetical protein
VQPTVTGKAPTKSSSISQTSSMKPTSTVADYVCGVGCGKTGCPIKPKPANPPKSGKPGAVARSLDAIAVPGVARDKYVMGIMSRNVRDELDWSINGATAVSKHGRFGSTPLTAWVTGIEGCTGVAVVSDKGYWLAHFVSTKSISLMASVNPHSRSRVLWKKARQLSGRSLLMSLKRGTKQ